MDLRKTHAHPFAFDAILWGVAAFGILVAYLSFSAGGIWSVLGGLALFGEFLLVWSVFVEPTRLKVTRYRLPLTSSPSTWLRIVFMSDLHAGGFRDKEWYGRVAREAQALQPDVLFLGGDYVADRSDVMGQLEVLSTLHAPKGRFFLLGNHDFLDRPQEIRGQLEAWGYSDLTNRSVIIDSGDKKLELRGVEDPWFGRSMKSRRSAPDVPHVTVCHEPDFIMDLKEGDTDLLVAGHTHGGQARLPFIGALWPVPAKMGKAVMRGEKMINGVRLIVSNGLSEINGRVRLLAPPEITVIEVGI